MGAYFYGKKGKGRGLFLRGTGGREGRREDGMGDGRNPPEVKVTKMNSECPP